MVMNAAERAALGEKMDTPNQVVKCPRCGKKLVYTETNHSIVVKCETTGCIHASLRGI